MLAFYLMYGLKIFFSHSVACLFTFLTVFCRSRSFCLKEEIFNINILFINHSLTVEFKSFLSNPRSWRFFYKLHSFTFKSILNCCFCKIFDLGLRFVCTIESASFIENLLFLHFVCFCTFIKIHWKYLCGSVFWALFILFSWPLCLYVCQYCMISNNCSYVVSLEIG